MSDAAAQSLAQEAARTANSQNATNEQSALKASQLLEKAFTEVHNRIQDQLERDQAWKARFVDHLENVSDSVVRNTISKNIYLDCRSSCRYHF